MELKQLRKVGKEREGQGIQPGRGSGVEDGGSRVFHRTSKRTCSSGCRRWKKRGISFCRSMRKCRKDPRRYRIQDKKKRLQKQSVAAQEEVRKIREEINQKEARIHLWQTRLTRTTCWKQDWKHNFEVCRQEKKEYVVMPHKEWMVVRETLRSNCAAMVGIRRGNSWIAFVKEVRRQCEQASLLVVQLPGREEGQECANFAQRDLSTTGLLPSFLSPHAAPFLLQPVHSERSLIHCNNNMSCNS